MPDKQPYSEFRELLRGAIGPNRTQNEFARTIGISREHLSRMLNSEVISQPSKKVLQKIAGNAYNGVTLSELMTACGYADGKQVTLNPAQDVRRNLSGEDSVLDIATSFRDGIAVLSAKNAPYASISLFLDTLEMLYSVSSATYEVVSDAENNLDSPLIPPSDRLCEVLVTVQSEKYIGQFSFTLFYSITRRDTVIVLGSAFDYKTLSTIGNKFIRELETSLPEDALDGIKGAEIVRNVTPKTIKRPVGDSAAAERLLKALFDDNGPKRIATVEGMGFYLVDTPKYVAERFIKKHSTVLCKTKAESSIVRELNEGSDFDEIMKKYRYDWRRLAATIMGRETGIRFSFWENDDERSPSPSRPSIMFGYSSPWEYNETEKELSQNSLRLILDRYAIELRTEVEECYFTMNVDA